MDWQILLVALALVFGFLNGFHDSSNVVATIIFSRVMGPRKVLLLTALMEFLGPFLFGVAVAKTIGADVIQASAINVQVLVAALLGGILWNLVTWYFGIPSSSSHALVGGLIGASLLAAGTQVILLPGLIKVLVALFLSPLVGLEMGFLVTRLVLFLARNATLRVNLFFKYAQLLTGSALALSHGTNDAQKTMGIIVLGLLAQGSLARFEVPFWVIAASAGVMSLGTALGGWRLIRTLGRRFYKIRPVDGFCSQVASTMVILGAALLGGPLSTTQVVSAAILGVGSAHRVSKVRWNVAGQIATAWLLTIPVTGLLSAGFYYALRIWVH